MQRLASPAIGLLSSFAFKGFASLCHFSQSSLGLCTSLRLQWFCSLRFCKHDLLLNYNVWVWPVGPMTIWVPYECSMYEYGIFDWLIDCFKFCIPKTDIQLLCSFWWLMFRPHPPESQWLLAYYYSQSSSALGLSNNDPGQYLDGWPLWFVNFCW